jgi:DNA-binding MarR family transcriptional regulator
MSLQQIDFSKVLNDEQVYDHMMANYDQLGKDWIYHQWKWTNAVYQAFNDHYKYMIIISLVEKTLQFYDQMNIKLSYDQFYSKTFLQIDKFSITELCEKLQLPKETVRRKVLELEKLGVLKRQKKQIIIDRRSFAFIKPENQMKYTAGYILKISEILTKEKLFSKKLDTKMIENILKKNFSITWGWFYRMQIPMIIGYHEMFEDLTTFHIWGTVCMNQAFNYKASLNKSNGSNQHRDYMNYYKEMSKGDYNTFNEEVISGDKAISTGVSAMSISDMTAIPRATVIRKCKFLVKNNYLQLNEKKQYILTGLNTQRILPYQKLIFKNKAKFIRKVLNLLTIS